eukprot:GHVN01072011.1.p1 GENE.GHVN01072011.1~~GHVN01072011.1.p1  ORF type:complete len:114 (-),score=22.80 GHVN01072011.1:702-1043(-)
MVVKDSIGRVGHRVDKQVSKITVDTRLDKSTTDKVVTAQDVLNQLWQVAEQKKSEANEKRGKKADAIGKIVKIREPHPLGAALDAEDMSDEQRAELQKVIEILKRELEESSDG